jgi:formylmethanofuran dehydrogenase subunit E
MNTTPLSQSADRHAGRLCPRQVLGVRMGLAGAAALGLEIPVRNKRLLVISETDGCFVDGLEAVTGCSVGHRTLRVQDYGKVAATFVDTIEHTALRFSPQPDVRERAFSYAPEQQKHYFAQLYGYQRMPTEELFSCQPVILRTPITDLVSRPGLRLNCQECGEEIINERQVWVGERCLCRACAGESYYLTQSATLINFWAQAFAE